MKQDTCHWVPPCAEEGTRGYWTATCWAADGTCHIATSGEKPHAEATALQKRIDYEEFLAKTPIEKLRELVAGDLLDKDQRLAIRQIHLVLEEVLRELS